MYEIFAAIVVRLYVNNLLNGHGYVNVCGEKQMIRYYLIPGANLRLFHNLVKKNSL